jgi:hypothetical protein
LATTTETEWLFLLPHLLKAPDRANLILLGLHMFIKLMIDEQWFAENHGKWAGFFNGEFVAADDDLKKLNDHLERTQDS